MSVYVKDLDFNNFDDAIAITNLIATSKGIEIAPSATEGHLLSVPIYPRLAEEYLGFEISSENSYVAIAIEKRGVKYEFIDNTNTWVSATERVYYTAQQIRNTIRFWMSQGDTEIQFRVRLQRDIEARSPWVTGLRVAYSYSGDLLTYLFTIALPQLLRISVTLMRDVQIAHDPGDATICFAPGIPGFELGKLQNINGRSRLGGGLVPCAIAGNRIKISKQFPTHLPAGILFDYSPLVEYAGRSGYQVRELPCVVISDPDEEGDIRNASHTTGAIAQQDGRYLDLFQSYFYNKTLEIKVAGRDEADVNLIASQLIATIKKKGFINASAIDKKIPLSVKGGLRNASGGQIKGEICVKSFDLVLINLLAGTT